MPSPQELPLICGTEGPAPGFIEAAFMEWLGKAMYVYGPELTSALLAAVGLMGLLLPIRFAWWIRRRVRAT